MNQRKLAGVAVTLLVAGMAAGCGAGGESSGSAGKPSTTSSSSAPLTKAQYVTQADAVCQQTITKINDAGKPLRDASDKSGKPPADKDVARFLTDSSLPAYDAMLDKLRDLTPPASDAKTIDALIGALAGAIDEVKANPLKFTQVAAGDPFDDANKRAKQYGMKVCGS